MSQLQFITPLINREWQIKRNEELRNFVYGKKSMCQQDASKFEKSMRGYPHQQEKAGKSLAC
jgi:hypothetical protein